MRKIIIILAAMLCVLALGGCSENEQTYAWPLATASPEDTVTQMYAERFVEEVSRLSDGEMKIQVYSNSTLGGDRELLESCATGDIPFVVQTTAPQVSFMPQLAVFDLPCAYSNLEDVRAALDEPSFQETINGIYTSKGYRLLGMADQSFRVMSTNKKIESLADFKGQKIRTMENQYHMAFWECLGANTTPMSFSEVYVGLQQGTIDAQENPYEVIVSSKFYEQQKYVVQTNHLPHLLSLIVSEEFYDTLTEEQQNILLEAAQIAKEYAREMADSRAEERMQMIVEGGAEIVGLSNELMEEMKQAAQPVYEQIRKVAGDELVDAYLGKN